MQQQKRIRTLLAVLFTLALGAGCTTQTPPVIRPTPDAGPPEVDAGPPGPDGYLLSGTWTVNGAAASVASCRESRIEQVRFRVTTEDAELVREITADCATGAFSDTEYLPWTTIHRGEWVALDVDGQVLQRIPTARPIQTVWPTDHFEAVPADFEIPEETPGDYRLSGTFYVRAFQGTTPITDDPCGYLGIETVQLVFGQGPGEEPVVASSTCGPDGRGKVDFEPVLLWNVHYYPRWEALDADGQVLFERVDEYLEVNAPTVHVYNYTWYQNVTVTN